MASRTHHNIVLLEEIMSAAYPTFSSSIPHTYTKYWRTLPSEIAPRIYSATIIVLTIAPITAQILDPSMSPNLQCIVIMATGTDCVDLEAARKRGIRVCYCPGANIDSVSEHALGMYFSLRRKFTLLGNAIQGEENKGNDWKMTGSMQPWLRMPDGEPPLTSADEVVGIMGYGMLGKRVEGLCRALGMEVRIAERKGAGSVREGRVSFEDGLRECSVLFLTLPKKTETANMVGEEEMAAMRKCAVLINVSRGGILDEQATLMAVKEGKIAGVGTDVFAVEPAGGSADSPLLSDEAKELNIVVTPHVAWFAQRTLTNLGRILKETVEAYCNGKPINVVI